MTRMKNPNLPQPVPTNPPPAARMIAAAAEQMERFELTFRLLAAEADLPSPAPDHS